MGFAGCFLISVLIFPAAYPQDETLAEIKYREDYDSLQKIAAVSGPAKRADLLVKFYREKSDADPQLKAYADNLFARDLEILMKQQDFAALRSLTERVLQIRPKFGEVYLFRGVVLKNDRKFDEAMEAFARCYVIKNPFQKKAKEQLDITYRARHKGSLIGQDKIIKKAMQDMK